MVVPVMVIIMRRIMIVAVVVRNMALENDDREMQKQNANTCTKVN